MKPVVSLLLAVVATSVATVAANDYTVSTVGAGLSSAEYRNAAAAPAAAISTEESLPSPISRLGFPGVKESDAKATNFLDKKQGGAVDDGLVHQVYPSFLFDSPITCDPYTEETCYDEMGYTAVSCASYDEGGCPCHEGEAKCGADDYYSGYCTAVCCDWDTEETCYDELTYDVLSCAIYDEGGCPCREGETKCGATADWPGFCTELCCDSLTEDKCWDEEGVSSCARIVEGGCPCPDSETRCGADEYYSGYCTPVCCDWDTEETCYDEAGYTPVSCAIYDEGGCPCREGETKCGATEDWPGYCTAGVCCDWATEETCYDDVTSTAVSCASNDEGGCPCPEGEAKCGADEYYSGYCTAGVCCDWDTEETCYDDVTSTPVSCARHDEGGCPCPEDEAKCGADDYYKGYCTSVCCDWATEETCYDEVTYDALSCARHDEGGCPCPEGEAKCGADEYYSGYCTAGVCCEWPTEETCYDDDGYTPSSCARFDEGGCPCPVGEVKCGADDYYTGYCTELCCESPTEETCYTEEGMACARIDEGGCPCPDSLEKCGADDTWSGYCTELCCDWETEDTCYDENYTAVSCARYDEGGCPSSRSDISLTTKTTPLLKVKEMAKEATLFRAFELRERDALAKKDAHKHAIKHEEKEEELALVRATKLREKALAKETALSRAIKLREKAALAKEPDQSRVIKRKAKDEEAALLRATKLREKEELVKKVAHSHAIKRNANNEGTAALFRAVEIKEKESFAKKAAHFHF